MRQTLQQACAPFQEQIQFINALKAEGVVFHFHHREWLLVREQCFDIVSVEPHRWLAHKGQAKRLLSGTPEEKATQPLGFWGTPKAAPERRSKACA